MPKRDALLQLMLDDMVRAPEVFRPTLFWEGGLPSLIEDLERYGIDSFRQHKNALNFFVPNYADPTWFHDRPQVDELIEKLKILELGLDDMWRDAVNGTTVATSDYRAFRASDNHDLPPYLHEVNESQYGAPLEQFTFDGQRVSRSFLNYMRMLTLLKRRVDTRPIRRVLEIGGGYGTLGEILLKSPGSDYFYVDVDIPPVGFVATRYLEKVFGADAVAGYDVTHDMEVISLDDLSSRGYRSAVLCPWQLPRLQGPFQLFVNSISFQEMEPHVVRNYADHVTRLVDNFVLMRNSRHGKPVAAGDDVAGVKAPLRRDDYVEIFSDFELQVVEAFVHGTLGADGFASEVMLLSRER